MKKLSFFLIALAFCALANPAQAQLLRLLLNNMDKVEDSVEHKALEDLYTSTNGAGWRNNRNWLQGDNAWQMSRWHGVTVLFKDVYNLILINNDLKGEIPASIANLREMRQLFLSNNELEGDVPASLVSASNLWFIKLNDNKLTGFPDFSAHSFVRYMIVDVSRNNLDFGDLEPNFSSAGRPKFLHFDYKHQDKIGAPDTLTFRENQEFEIVLLTGGQYNRYQWQKKDTSGNWADVTGATRYFYGKESFSEADRGVYRCRVTNEWVNGLTLYTHDYTVEMDEHHEISFRIDTRDMPQGLGYEVMAEGLSGAYPFGGTEEFTLTNPTDTATILLNLLNGTEPIGLGYSFKVDPEHGHVSELKLVKGMDKQDLNGQLFQVQGGQLTLLPLQPHNRVWPDFHLLLQDGLRLTRNGDGHYDVLAVAGAESAQSFSLEIKNRNEETVFATTDKAQPWDGTDTNTSTPVPNGVYRYTLSIDGSTVKGQFFVE